MESGLWSAQASPRTCSEAPFGRGDLHMVDGSCDGTVQVMCPPMRNCTPALHTGRPTLRTNRLASPRFIFGRKKGGARRLRADVGQGRFDAHRLVGADDLAFASPTGASALRGRARRQIPSGWYRNARMPWVRWSYSMPVSRRSCCRPHGCKGAQAHDLLDVVACARRGAVAQELQAPETGAGRRARETAGASSWPSHCSTLSGALRLAQGSALADRNLPAVGEAGFGARRSLAVDHGHVVAALLEVISRSDTEQAGAENDYAHFGAFQGFQRLMDKR